MSQRETLDRTKVPLTVDGRLVPTLLSISKSMRALIALRLTKLGFFNGQDELLFVLDEKAPTSVSRLAEEIAVRPSTVSKMLDRLIEKGMIERKADVRDARRTMVQITPTGLEARTRLQALRDELEAELVPPLSQNAEGMIEALGTVSDILKSRLSRLR